MSFHAIRRRVTSVVMTSLCGLSVVLVLVPVALILTFVVTKGIGSLNWAFFTELPKPVGETGGGMGNAILGTLMICGLAATFAVPTGVMSGLYVAEYHGTRFADLDRNPEREQVAIVRGCIGEDGVGYMAAGFLGIYGEVLHC